MHNTNYIIFRNVENKNYIFFQRKNNNSWKKIIESSGILHLSIENFKINNINIFFGNFFEFFFGQTWVEVAKVLGLG
jgi:hypothetical protein